ncbi:MAG TPA: hypothetical protein VGB24_00305 [Longimicrobium sp.]|jgi:hypothetical protein|uniref:hypothetical protein n=1 Tax=Longimicrobium sp. TaxID=2029185 RepID=UPI002ED9AB57
MARRPNYNFEKRQKEIDKQKKKEEKAAKKLARKEGGDDDELGGVMDEGTEGPGGETEPADEDDA